MKQSLKRIIVCSLLSISIGFNLSTAIFAQEETDTEEYTEETSQEEQTEEIPEEETIVEEEEVVVQEDESSIPDYAAYTGFDYTTQTSNTKRLAALNKAKQMITVLWTSPCDFRTWDYYPGTAEKSFLVTDIYGYTSYGYKRGHSYQGIPYSQDNRYYDDIAWKKYVNSGSMTTTTVTNSKGGCTKGIDCSAFVSVCLRAAGATGINLTSANIPSNTSLKKLEGNTWEERFEKLQPGDVLRYPGHAALYAGSTIINGKVMGILFETGRYDGCVQDYFDPSDTIFEYYTLKSYGDSPVYYKINYVLNGGTINPNSRTTIMNTDVPLLEPTRNGYTFEGWYSDSSFTKPISTISASKKSNTTVYAKWKAIPYTISYECNGGNNSIYNIGVYTTAQTITLKNPTRTGYSFAGWYTDPSYTTKVTSIAQGTYGNKTLYAKWNPISYTISYVLNGGKNNTENPKSYNIESSIDLKEPSRTGYSFVGWYSDKACTKQVTNISNNTGNKTLYAKWSAIKYSVNYILNGGTNNSGNPSTHTVVTAITLKNPTRAGYKFLGWYNTETNKKITSIASGQAKDYSLEARWQKITYSITYVCNYGKNDATNPKTYDVESNLEIKAPTKTGYTFIGWYTDKACTKPIQNISQGMTGNKTLYAKWQKQ